MEQALSDILGKPQYSLNGAEYALLKESATHFPDGIASKLWGKVMLRAVIEAEHQEARAKALELTGICYDELDRVFPQMFDEKAELLKNACLFSLKENDQETAYKKMESYLYNALAQVHYHNRQ